MMVIVYFFFLYFFPQEGLAELLTPQGVLGNVLKDNPELSSFEAIAQAEDNLISSQYSLASPQIGYMKETDMSLMQRQDGPMKTWSISQEFLFPSKYFSKGAIQSVRAKKARYEYQHKKLEIRAAALTAYFRFYSASRVLTLLQAQRETLREIARIAETRRAAGSVPQQDEMKAHVEQTKIENQILLGEQEVLEAKFTLNSLLNRDSEAEIEIPENDFTARKDAKVSSEIDSLSIDSSYQLLADSSVVVEVGLKKSLAKMNYLPDFMFSYRQAFGVNNSNAGNAFGVEMTIPLWFLSKENSELSSALSQEVSAKRRFEAQKRSIESSVSSLKNRVKTLSKLLEIYETALIPQATSTLNSSRSAYSAGKVAFQELLDAERTLYSTRIEYYEIFSKYIEALTRLEREAGKSISSLPFSGEKI